MEKSITGYDRLQAFIRLSDKKTIKEMPKTKGQRVN